MPNVPAGRGPLLDSPVAEILRCPRCRGHLRGDATSLTCESCAATFPVVDGIPVLLNEERSIFSASEAVKRHGIDKLLAENSAAPTAPLKERFFDALPKLSHNWKADTNLAQFSSLLAGNGRRSRVVIVGGGVLGAGVEALTKASHIELIETDIYFGPRTRVVCDAGDLPFEDQSIDGVVLQGVLGNLLDPERAISEIFRVLTPTGIVYCEAPFVQQVSLGPYDFTRYTRLGLRRLFRRFDEIASGAQGGPGMAAAWAYQFLLWGFTASPRKRAWLRLFARLTGFWLVSLDRFLVDRPAALDGASGLFFLGRRSERTMTDREILADYRGGYT
jgi:uncharacterized protein YbaR (Trm112 family)